MTQTNQDPTAAGALRNDQNKLIFGEGFSFSGYERDAAFRAATDLGLHPQPGLALLRLAEDRVAVAARMIQQALCEVGLNDLPRAKLLPAAVQIGVAADDLDVAPGDRTPHPIGFRKKAGS